MLDCRFARGADTRSCRSGSRAQSNHLGRHRIHVDGNQRVGIAEKRCSISTSDFSFFQSTDAVGLSGVDATRLRHARHRLHRRRRQLRDPVQFADFSHTRSQRSSEGEDEDVRFSKGNQGVRANVFYERR